MVFKLQFYRQCFYITTNTTKYFIWNTDHFRYLVCVQHVKVEIICTVNRSDASSTKPDIRVQYGIVVDRKIVVERVVRVPST